jgi:hypothetical protein
MPVCEGERYFRPEIGPAKMPVKTWFSEVALCIIPLLTFGFQSRARKHDDQISEIARVDCRAKTASTFVS